MDDIVTRLTSGFWSPKRRKGEKEMEKFEEKRRKKEYEVTLSGRRRQRKEKGEKDKALLVNGSLENQLEQVTRQVYRTKVGCVADRPSYQGDGEVG